MPTETGKNHFDIQTEVSSTREFGHWWGKKMSIYDTRKWIKNYRRKKRKRCLEQIFFWNFFRDSKDFTWAKEEEVIQNKNTTTGIGNTFLWPLLGIIFLKLWFIPISYGLSLREFFYRIFFSPIIIATKPKKDLEHLILVVDLRFEEGRIAIQ